MLTLTGEKILSRLLRNHPLSDVQEASYRLESKSKARVEHIFGSIISSMDKRSTRIDAEMKQGQMPRYQAKPIRYYGPTCS